MELLLPLLLSSVLLASAWLKTRVLGNFNITFIRCALACSMWLVLTVVIVEVSQIGLTLSALEARTPRFPEMTSFQFWSAVVLSGLLCDLLILIYPLKINLPRAQFLQLAIANFSLGLLTYGCFAGGNNITKALKTQIDHVSGYDRYAQH